MPTSLGYNHRPQHYKHCN